MNEKKRIVRVLYTLLVAGGLATSVGCGGDDGTSCTVNDSASGAIIECDDGTSATIEDGETGPPGDPGEPGAPGDPGDDGEPCTVAENAEGGATITCPDGATATIEPGPAGSSCSVAENPDGTATITCEDGTMAVIGEPGTVEPGTNARLQVVHLSPDPAAATVDVYVNDALLLDDLTFNSGTNFFPVPAGAALEIDIVGGDAVNNDSPVYSTTLPALDANENYIAAATGLVAPGTPPEQAFDLVVTSGTQTGANAAANVDALVLHAIPDAPAVDIVIDNGAAQVSDVAFRDFSPTYLTLEPSAARFGDVSVIGLQVAANDAFVRGFQTPALSTLAGNALLVAASGLLSGDYGLIAFPAAEGDNPTITPGLPLTQAARLQAIHNAADPGAASVDVYFNDILLIDDFDFRAATPYLTVPSDTDFDIGVAPANSMSAADALATFDDVALAPGSVNIAVANGVLDPTQFSTAANPAGTIAFNLFLSDGQETAAMPTDVALKAFHGATDAPAVGVRAQGAATNLIDTFSYGDFAGYLQLPATVNAVLEIFDPTTVGAPALLQTSAAVDLGPFAGQGILVLASGFLDPTLNQSGPAFALLAVTPGGDTVTLPVN